MTKVRDLDQLLDVAARLFGEYGYEATTLEQIAQELGILKGSLYHYISSKAELHLLVTTRRLQQLIDEAERIAALDIPADEKLRQALRRHLQTIHDFYPESSQWFVQPAPPRSGGSADGELRPNRVYEHVIRRIVQAGVDEGVFRSDLDVPVMTLSVLGSANWLTHWYQRGGRLSIDEIGDTIIGLALDGLAAPRPSRAASRAAVSAHR
jgi:AcrR family transcriptional regulator